MPPLYKPSADFDAVVAHTAPAILALLGDGRPRSKKAIVTALAERHPKDEIVRTLMPKPSIAASRQLTTTNPLSRARDQIG
ncbi:MAG: hypothetical protein WAS21_17715 [Geminicoccaceae bacterium]